ncbi:MAG: DUF2085 domain-containing protein [Kiritimatiellae bacterium]|nr:DUF2085 domain-containing protein [Kiritimatiellia bacterium]
MATAACLVFAASCLFCIPCKWELFSLCLLLMLPAGIDFTMEELLAAYPASNVSRFVTGFLFGMGGGICLVWLFLHGKWGPILFFIGGAIVMQFVIALIFRRLGHLESYLEKYESAVGINPKYPKHEICDCPTSRDQERIGNRLS